MASAALAQLTDHLLNGYREAVEIGTMKDKDIYFAFLQLAEPRLKTCLDQAITVETHQHKLSVLIDTLRDLNSYIDAGEKICKLYIHELENTKPSTKPRNDKAQGNKAPTTARATGPMERNATLTNEETAELNNLSLKGLNNKCFHCGDEHHSQQCPKDPESISANEAKKGNDIKTQYMRFRELSKKGYPKGNSSKRK